MNFACSSRARGFDLQNVIVFPTDMETKELAEEMGLATFYEDTLMVSMPKEEEALTYGDEIFADIMFAKVLCVQLVNELGYDLLFQDVDMVWFKSPLDFFQDESLPSPPVRMSFPFPPIRVSLPNCRHVVVVSTTKYLTPCVFDLLYPSSSSSQHNHHNYSANFPPAPAAAN